MFKCKFEILVVGSFICNDCSAQIFCVEVGLAVDFVLYPTVKSPLSSSVCNSGFMKFDEFIHIDLQD